MIVPRPVDSGGDRTSHDCELLTESGLLDEAGYRQRAGLPSTADAAAHYLNRGWLLGLEPCEGFEGQFLLPYYQSAGLTGPPALTWLELSIMPGRRVPSSRAEAESMADRFRSSPFFDAAEYARRLPTGLDPAVHYVVVGEVLGWPPSSQFDPAYYLDRYGDVARALMSPLDHFNRAGRLEGRRPLPAVARLQFPALPDRSKRTVVVTVHEASLTGAPVVSWNIARQLAESYHVVTVLLLGGVLEKQFVAVSSATVGPLTWEEWSSFEMSRLARRLVDKYDPVYAVANSVESHLLVPALARLGVPSVALVHEFAAYTRPVERMRDVFDWATHVVFPARAVAQSAFASFPSLERRRGVHLLPQGRVDIPPIRDDDGQSHDNEGSDVARLVRPASALDSFVVLGAGTIHIRKGVDLFLATAAAARRLAPDVKFRFVWIGDGYDPVADSGYSTYLAEQIARSDLADVVSLLDHTEYLNQAFANADVFFMCSRLDPQPNVSIEAMMLGLPTVCFAGASGTAEVLAADPQTSSLVVPDLDAHGAAEVICRLAASRGARSDLAEDVKRVASKAYDMPAYVRQVDAWGREARAALRTEDLATLVDTCAVDPDLAVPRDVIPPGEFGLERHVLQQWSVVRTSVDQVSNPHFRRPCAGFHPQLYAQAHADACVRDGIHPLAHWLRAGRPGGPWSRRVFSPLETFTPPPERFRVALHGHFYHVDAARELATRLSRNAVRCDLFLTTDTDVKAHHLRTTFAGTRGALDVRVTPNCGRDIGPFLTGLEKEIRSGGYDIFGHVHGKQSHDARMGHEWREFLWDNLVGGTFPMIDVIASAFEHHRELGLIIAEDPHLVGWDANRPIAEPLAVRMGMPLPLDDFFDFPLGNMFWVRPKAVEALLDLRLEWSDYPDEPVAYDGTLLHALERLVPLATRRAALDVGGVRAPGTTW
jgi:glycosyltransferase involved in cell wall biosynthesis